MLLAGDVGGTKTILALYDIQEGQLVEIKKQQYASSECRQFTELLHLFVADYPSGAIATACIGVAGPIVDGDCSATNLPWQVRRSHIAGLLQLDVNKVRLLNDLEATAWGILHLSVDNFVELNPNATLKLGHVAVLAAGTGLGEALICWDGERYTVMPSEGGHVDFAPNNETEIGLLRFLMQLYSGHVSYERVVSGMGLINIYQYLKASQFAAEQAKIAELMQQQDPGAVIGEYGQSGADALCVETLRIFCRIYGAQAGNLALTALPSGGVVLAGGIAAKIISVMRQEYFMQGFLDKGRYYDALQRFSVRVCLNPEAALLGAAAYAQKINLGDC